MRDAYYFPAAHACDVIEVGQSLGLDMQSVLADLSLSLEVLREPDARISLPLLEALIARVQALSGRRSLGIDIGLRMRAPVHGYLGFALIASPTLRDGLQLVARYTPTRTNALHAELSIEEREAILYWDTPVDLGSARDTVITAVAVSAWQIAQGLTNVRFAARCDFAFPSPSGARTESVRELSLHYGQPRSCLRFAVELLELPVPTAQPTGYRLARAQCERELEVVGHDSWTARANDAMRRAKVESQNVEDVARLLGASASTLKRKLKIEGTSFSDLLDLVQRERSCELLRTPQLSIEEIAERVGYTDVSNFGRAFRRWTGLTPAAYRRANVR